MEEDILNILRETAQLLRDTAQDRRDQANMFYDLLQKQAKAISDSEERIGKINTMVNNVLEQAKEQSRIAADNAASLHLALQRNESLAGELHSAKSAIQNKDREIAEVRRFYTEMVKTAYGTTNNTSENIININKGK